MAAPSCCLLLLLLHLAACCQPATSTTTGPEVTETDFLEAQLGIEEEEETPSKPDSTREESDEATPEVVPDDPPAAEHPMVMAFISRLSSSTSPRKTVQLGTSTSLTEVTEGMPLETPAGGVFNILLFKLDGVSPVDRRPSPDKLYHFSKSPERSSN